MASVPSVTLDKIDLVVSAVADRILSAASDRLVNVRDVSDAFRSFAAGVGDLVGLVPVPEPEFAGHSSVEQL